MSKKPQKRPKPKKNTWDCNWDPIAAMRYPTMRPAQYMRGDAVQTFTAGSKPRFWFLRVKGVVRMPDGMEMHIDNTWSLPDQAARLHVLVRSVAFYLEEEVAPRLQEQGRDLLDFDGSLKAYAWCAR